MTIATTTRMPAGSNGEATGATAPGVRRDIYWITAQPGRARQSAPHGRGVVDHVILSTGRALVGVAADPVELGPGDYIAYPGDLAHTFAALVPDTVAVLISEHP